MTEPDDHSLVREAQNGNRQAFAMLVQRHYAPMYKLAWQWSGVKEEAEDITQEATIKMAQNIGAFKFEAAFTTWLYRLVVNTAKDHQKSRKRRHGREDRLYDDAVYMSADLSPEQNVASQDVLRLIAGLPEALKEAVILCHWQGFSQKEAGVILQCPEGTVAWRLSEARKKISHALALQDKGRPHG